jgi:outer membrane protein TolC
LVGAEARLLSLRESESEVAEVVRLTANFAASRQGREGDAQRARSEALLLQDADVRLQESVSRAAADLARLLSVDPANRLRSEPGAPPYIQLVDANLSLATLIQQALARRPEIAARSADVVRFETRLRQERVRPLLPTIAVGFSAGDFGGGSDLAGYRFSHFNSRADFDVVAFWTLQNLGIGNLALQNRARAEIGEAEAVRARAIDMVRRQVTEAVAQADTHRLQAITAKNRVASARAGFREDLLRAKNLEGHLIEVLNSFNLLTAARQDLVMALIEYSQSQFRLYVALGNTPAE